ncbi:MAG: response regulator [Verrucomicrobiota bacterium]|jgi:DNA-binding response OmpR family regulator
MKASYSELRHDTLPDTPEVSRHGPQTINQAGGDKAPTTPKRSLHILCIDDDEQILEMMKDCLAHYEHRVRVASGGKYGMELFRTAMLKSEPYEVVITDLVMPDMDGYQVARVIKTESPNTPIIMITGRDTLAKEGGAISSAVDAVVDKPPHIEELNNLLLRIVKPAKPS